jgi:hypothetical protein
LIFNSGKKSDDRFFLEFVEIAIFSDLHLFGLIGVISQSLKCEIIDAGAGNALRSADDTLDDARSSVFVVTHKSS